VPRVDVSTLSFVGSGRRSIVAATLKSHSDGADVAVSHTYPGVLKQHPSDKGNDKRFYKTVKQVRATHGHGPKVAGI